MPNWCTNYAEVTHPDRRKIVELRRAFRKGLMLSYICPVPDDIRNSDGQECYDFCVREWGTKWEVDGEESWENGVLALSFDSAWAPPTAVYEKMLAQGYTVDAKYHESGSAFVGQWVDGVDDYYEYNECDYRTVRDYIGEELDDFFCVSEQMREWADEEELTEWLRDGVKQRKTNEDL